MCLRLYPRASIRARARLDTALTHVCSFRGTVLQLTSEFLWENQCAWSFEDHVLGTSRELCSPERFQIWIMTLVPVTFVYCSTILWPRLVKSIGNILNADRPQWFHITEKKIVVKNAENDPCNLLIIGTLWLRTTCSFVIHLFLERMVIQPVFHSAILCYVYSYITTEKIQRYHELIPSLTYVVINRPYVRVIYLSHLNQTTI